MSAISSIWLWIAALLPGLSKDLRNNVIEKVILVGNLVEKLGVFLKDDIFDRLFPKARAPIITQQALQNAFGNVFANIDSWFNVAKTTLQDHAKFVAQKIEPDDQLRPWRMFGYFFQLLFLGLFAYADVIQVINNLALIFPQDVPNVPTWLANLTLSLLMSSVGIAIAAGFILAEFGGVTHFGKWNELTGNFRKVVYGLVWFSLISVLLIDGILAISRIKSIPEVAQALSPEMSLQLTIAASIASSLVIIPMIIITAMFLQGFVGFAVIYIILLWLLSLVAELLHLIFVWTVWVFTFGISYLIDFILRAVLFIIVALLLMFGWFFAGSGLTIQKILEVLQAILNVVYFPMDAIIGWIARMFTKQN